MNNHTSFVLLAILTVFGALTMSSAYAAELPDACVGCAMEDARETANQMLLDDIPLSVWTDKTEYDHSEIIMVQGRVANESGFPVTITVTNPLRSIVAVDQIDITDGSFETTINTSGAIWKYDGIYIIKVNYGSALKSTIQVELVGGVAYEPVYDTPSPSPSKQCGANELSASGQCIPFSISGGVVTGASINTDDKSIVIMVDTDDDGILTVTPSKKVQNGIFLVLVDGEESNDTEIVGNKVTVMFPAGTEQIEIIGTYVIPEFGTIAAMILAVAIISIIAISARSKLSIIPRY